jgi:hypothetical protein
MNLFGIILGLIFAGLGVNLTYQAWHFASQGHLVATGGYVGPFLVMMGLFRFGRSAAGLPPNLVLRYVFLGIAILAGIADRAVIKAVYPNAVPFTVPLQH